MRSILDLIVIALATNQIIEIWRHSSLFQPVRYRLQCHQEDYALTQPTILRHVLTWPADLLLCNWCLSVWVALALVIAIPYSAGYMIVLAFATSRVANLVNDVAYAYLRTPKYDDGPLHFPAMESSIDETIGPVSETRSTIPATKTGLFDTPDSVSAKRNDEYKPPSSSAPPSGPIQ